MLDNGVPMRMAWLPLLVILSVALPVATAEAHVRVSPAESKAGARETYTARVPTEGTVTTTSVELEVPDGVAIISANAPAGTSYEFKKNGDRIVAVVWTTNIKPGDVAMLSFVARNPDVDAPIVWKFHQRYADGTSSDWIGPAGSRTPAPVTKLVSVDR